MSHVHRRIQHLPYNWRRLYGCSTERDLRECDDISDPTLSTPIQSTSADNSILSELTISHESDEDTVAPLIVWKNETASYQSLETVQKSKFRKMRRLKLFQTAPKALTQNDDGGKCNCNSNYTTFIASIEGWSEKCIDEHNIMNDTDSCCDELFKNHHFIRWVPAVVSSIICISWCC